MTTATADGDGESLCFGFFKRKLTILGEPPAIAVIGEACNGVGDVGAFEDIVEVARLTVAITVIVGVDLEVVDCGDERGGEESEGEGEGGCTCEKRHLEGEVRFGWWWWYLGTRVSHSSLEIVGWDR